MCKVGTYLEVRPSGIFAQIKEIERDLGTNEISAICLTVNDGVILPEKFRLFTLDGQEVKSLYQFIEH